MRTVWLRPRKQRSVSAIATSNLESTVEADSHADTFCLGAGTLCVYDYNTPVSVQGYDPSLGAKEYSVISGAIKYIQPYTGAIYHMIIHQAVHMPQLDHHLMCPNQCRAHGVIVNDCPRINV